jgi:hypothetical protein
MPRSKRKPDTALIPALAYVRVSKERDDMISP